MDRAYEGAKVREAAQAPGLLKTGRTPKRNRTTPWHYDKRHNEVERFFRNLKHYRKVATRYDKLDTTFLATIQLALITLHLRHPTSVNTP